MHAELVERYLKLQLNGDRRGALAIIDQALQAGGAAVDVALNLVSQAQRRIGELWQEDRISIAQEHMATAISQVALAYLYQRTQSQPVNGKKVLVACVAGELHDFPVRLVADTLDLAGYAVRYLGADVPTPDLIEAVVRESPDVVALSITMPFNAPALQDACARLRAAAPAVPIAVGGHACLWSPELGPSIGADFLARDAAELLAALNRHFGVEA